MIEVGGKSHRLTAQAHQGLRLHQSVFSRRSGSPGGITSKSIEFPAALAQGGEWLGERSMPHGSTQEDLSGSSCRSLGEVRGQPGRGGLLSGCLALSRHLPMTLPHTCKPACCATCQSWVPASGRGTRRCSAPARCAQLPAGVPVELGGHQGLRDVAGRWSGGQ